MNYSIDLLKHKVQSQMRVVVGSLLILFACFYGSIKLYNHLLLGLHDYLYMLFMALWGVSLVVSGKGNSLERLLGSAYVKIDQEIIEIKLSAFDKKQHIFWSDVNSISYRKGNYIFTKKDQSIYKINITRLEYSIIQDIKNVIDQIAQEKNIVQN